MEPYQMLLLLTQNNNNNLSVMEQQASSSTPVKVKKTPTKPPKSSLLSQVDPCFVCKKKGGNQTCKTCKHKICMDCIHEETRECNTCEFDNNVFKAKTRGKPQYADQFKMGSSTSAHHPSSMPSASTPQQVKTPGRVTQLIWSAAAGLFGGSNKKKEENAMTPVQPAMSFHAQMAQQQTPAAAGSTSPTSKDLIKKLKLELKNVTALNAQLQAKLDDRVQANATAASIPAGNQTMLGATFLEVPSSGGGREEDLMRIVDLQLQLSEANTNVHRLESELLLALEREQSLKEKNASLLAQLQQPRGVSITTSLPGAGNSVRSAIPPCPPLPGTRESEEWKAQVKAGVQHPASAWLESLSAMPATMPQQQQVIDALSDSLGNVTLKDGKKRSEIPPPPPLPAGMSVAPGKLAGLRLSVGGGRRGSAPAVMETVPVQRQRRASIFATVESKVDLKPLYWPALDADRAEGTIFSKMEEEDSRVRPEKMRKELQMLEQRFAKKPRATAAAPATASEIAAAPVSQISIMDGKRKQQIGIVLNSAFRGVEFSTLRKAITTLDCKVLTESRIKQLLEMIPTPEETKNIQDLQSGNMFDAAFFARITKEEQFFLDMAAIPRVKSRLQCLAIVMQLAPNMDQLEKDCELFLQAVTAVQTGERWKQFLHLCLETGNYLNSGNANLSGAWGFKLKEGLTKLIETKSCENNSTFTLMHWIAQLAAAHHPDLFKLEEDFFIVNEASALSLSEMQKDLAAYTKQLDLVKEEIKHCAKINPEETSHAALLNTMKPFADKMSLAMDLLKQQVDHVAKESQNLVAMHGEDPKVDTCSELFKTVLGGVYSFLKCKQDNDALALKQQQTAPPSSATKVKPASSSAASKIAAAGKPQESVIAQDSEFQMKMERQKQKRAAAAAAAAAAAQQ